MIIIEASGEAAKKRVREWARGDRHKELGHLFVRHLGNGTYALRDCSESLLFAEYVRRLYPGDVDVFVAERLFDWEIPKQIVKEAERAARNPKSFKGRHWGKMVEQLPKTRISLKKKIVVK